jgi:hypothetical protein
MYVIGDIKLGTWANGQRAKYKKGILEQDKIARLESLPGWSWDPLGESWDKSFALLLEFSEEFGHVSVPSELTHYKDRDLSGWLKRQRFSYNKGKLEQKKIAQLESLPGWSWNPHGESWDSFFSLLLEFSEEFGHALVPQGSAKSLYKDRDLSSWVNTQRARHKKGILERYRSAQLESLPRWSWNPRSESWDSFFTLLLEFSEEFGHALVPQGSAKSLYKDRDLSRWVNKQRTRYNTGILEQHKVAQLESANGWTWNPFGDSWDSFFTLLLEFSEEFGHVTVPRKPTHYKKWGLASWVQGQRTNYKKGTLEQDRISQLESLSGWSWDPHGELWERTFDALNSYVIENGSATLAKSYVIGDIQLGDWVSTQRTKYKRGRLPKERIERLEALRGWTWSTKI